MRIFAISDTHFTLDPNRSMEGFGPIWRNHQQQILHNAAHTLRSTDILLIGGDITWEKTLPKASTHLRQLNDLPGLHKVIVKGNHDHWWKKRPQLEEILPKGMQALQGTATKIRGQVFAGTRAWLAPNDPCSDALDRKTYEKELKLLKEALDAAMSLEPKEGIHLLLHFPPFTTQGETTPFWDLLTQYPVVTCTYGHFHMPEEFELIPKGMVEGISCNLTSADYIKMTPTQIWPIPA